MTDLQRQFRETLQNTIRPYPPRPHTDRFTILWAMFLAGALAGVDRAPGDVLDEILNLQAALGRQGHAILSWDE